MCQCGCDSALQVCPNCDTSALTGPRGKSVAIATYVEAAGVNCAYGGIRIEVGDDNNLDGVPDANITISYLCNTTNGATPTLIMGTVTTLAAGASVTATLVATANPNEYALNLGIPVGAQGLYGGFSTEFKWSTNNAISDPTANYIKSDDTDMTAVGTISVSETNKDGVNIAAFLATAYASNNVPKAWIKLFKKSDSTKFHMYSVTSGSDSGTWRQLVVSHLSGTAAYTFAADDDVILTICPAGSAGTNGSNGAAGAAGANAPSYVGTSASNTTIGTGAQVFTTQAGLAYAVGVRVKISRDNDATAYMEGMVTGYSGTTLNVDVTGIGGSGTYNNWNIALTGAPGTDANQILSVTRTLSSAEILALFTTPIELVPAPGANKYIHVISASAYNNFNTVAYANGVDQLLLRVNANVWTFPNSFTEAVADTANMGAVVPDLPIQLNQELDITTSTANPTLGDGTITITVLYKIVG